ncbi:NTP transferase domain-containing protein [Shewanella sp. SM74]|uniref:NTP transferase domain-containing protein n=1 Tax=Shewanella sp. SM74 TaxID=2912807 RepID=UPI0021D972B0|nr:NTP transferase domain-containing protein [Shewanella sp. SM74]MCU8014165.1 NTP transferase domain-containing protein [Shewanella sp. SM74]
MQLIENVVIAAAGMGARIGLGIPKCMIDIEGTNLLSRLINLLDGYCKNIVVVVGYRA